MRNRVVVLSLTKNEIVIKKKKNKAKKSYVFNFSIVAIMIVIAFCFLNNSVLNSVISVFNPVNSLYNDNSDVIFTSGTPTRLEFSLPILGANVEINKGVITFTTAHSIMIKAPEAGVVIDLGESLDGVKYLKIKHNNSITSIIENVDILGVSKNEIVKKGQDIATSKQGHNVTLRIYEDEVLIQNVKLDKSKIVWQN